MTDNENKCGICDNAMIRFAQDYWYWYYKCPECGLERLIEKKEEERGYQR